MARGRPPRNEPTMQGTMTEQEDRSRYQFNRENDRISTEVDVRKRPSIYDMPDYDSIDLSSATARLQLVAPPPRIDPKYGRMRQYWADYTMDNGRRIYDMQRVGWTVRHPNTVDPAYASFATEQWHGHDVIMVANRHILMEIPDSFYKEKIEKRKHRENIQKVEAIRRKHGSIVRDGQEIEERMRDVESFSKEVIVNREDSGGDINFAD